VHIWISAVVVSAAAAATVACGSRLDGEPAEPVHTIQPAPSPAAAPSPATAAIHPAGALPPNADGDPACPVADAWGRAPLGSGIVVTHWGEDTSPVTVLVRTNGGSDQAQRALVDRGELRLFEFPEIDEAAVSEVLIMTNTRRCYVSADPATLG
jgi:hypothetical protein